MYEQHKICNTSYNRFKLHVFLQLPDCQFPNKTNVKRNTKTDVNFICMRNIILPLINCLCYVVLKMRCFKNQKIWNFAITLWIIYLLFDKVSFPLVHCNITQTCFFCKCCSLSFNSKRYFVIYIKFWFFYKT